MISDDALQQLAYELGPMIGEREFDRIYFARCDMDTAIYLQAYRGARSIGYKFKDAQTIDIPVALDWIRGYFRRHELN